MDARRESGDMKKVHVQVFLAGIMKIQVDASLEGSVDINIGNAAVFHPVAHQGDTGSPETEGDFITGMAAEECLFF